MHELKIFENEEFGQVRTMQNEKGKVLFCGTDVAKALGYKDTNNALKRHCKQDGVAFRHLIDNLGRTQETKFINEGNVYRLITKSKLPSAERFETWVFEEVLPTIREYGGYITWDKLQDIYSDPNNLAEFLENMARVTRENIFLKKQLADLEPKADYFNALIDSNLLVNFRTTAKALGIKPMQFTQMLLDKKYVFRDTKQIIHPMQNYVHDGLFEIKEFCRNGYSGTQTLITPKGRQHFLEVCTQWEII